MNNNRKKLKTLKLRSSAGMQRQSRRWKLAGGHQLKFSKLLDLLGYCAPEVDAVGQAHL